MLAYKTSKKQEYQTNTCCGQNFSNYMEQKILLMETIYKNEGRKNLSRLLEIAKSVSKKQKKTARDQEKNIA